MVSPLINKAFEQIRVRSPRAAVLIRKGKTVSGWYWLRGLVAAARAGFPARGLTVIGVTGTDGKTTTATMIYQVLKAGGIRVGLVTTIAAEIAGEQVDTGFHVTSPDPDQLHRLLASMKAKGITHVVLEVTSHGLAQHRVWGVPFDCAVLTNITPEHLDNHASFEEYRAVKARLFAHARCIVLNNDDPSTAFIRERSDAAVVRTYALVKSADLKPELVEKTDTGSHSSFSWGSLSLPLPGDYNILNALAALQVGQEYAVSKEVAVQSLKTMKPLAGRYEYISQGQPFSVIVDFAHTPHALEQVLRTTRERYPEGSVILVFGCAGLRDVKKRPTMGRIASKYAHKTFVTAEDPRTETVEAISSAIAEGLRSGGAREGEHFWRIPDRREAISAALGAAKNGDVVLITGKGHEQSMCFGTQERPWSDQVAVRALLAEKGFSK